MELNFAIFPAPKKDWKAQEIDHITWIKREVRPQNEKTMHLNKNPINPLLHNPDGKLRLRNLSMSHFSKEIVLSEPSHSKRYFKKRR